MFGGPKGDRLPTMATIKAVLLPRQGVKTRKVVVNNDGADERWCPSRQRQQWDDVNLQRNSSNAKGGFVSIHRMGSPQI